jgi:long-chain acyl-CoA synthetase
MTANVDQLLRQTVRRQPDHPAILGPRSAALSYRKLDEAIEGASRWLSACGVRAGDCVGLHYPSGAGYIVYTYAIWRCGGCAVPIPTELTASEKSEICRCLALDHALSPQSSAGFAEEFRRGEPRLGENGNAGDVLVPVQSPRQHPPGFRELNAAFIRFTSGTTGASKGVVLSHETIAERIAAANVALGLGPADRVLWVLSMSYHFTVSIVAYLTYGASVVLPANHFAAAIVAAANEHSATLLYASPLHYALLADFPQGAPLPRLRLAISTTAALDEPVGERFFQRYGRRISQALGIIEGGLPCVNNSAERWGSVGRLLPPYRLKLDEAELEDGLREVLLGGPGFLDAYYHPWQTRSEIMPDGWFRTGDAGFVDRDGYLFLRGRTKDVISVMGMKFFPYEVEQALAAHPLVRAASVFARRDPRSGEQVHARVVVAGQTPAQELEQALRQHLRLRLATYKVPERIEFVAALPQTASGKVLRRTT